MAKKSRSRRRNGDQKRAHKIAIQTAILVAADSINRQIVEGRVRRHLLQPKPARGRRFGVKEIPGLLSVGQVDSERPTPTAPYALSRAEANERMISGQPRVEIPADEAGESLVLW